MSVKKEAKGDSRGQGTTMPIAFRPLGKAILSRRPITPSKGTVRVSFPSTKMNRSIQCESQLEHKAALHLEMSPGVLNYNEQYEKHTYFHEGAYRKYYPDFRVEFWNGSIAYFEVKPISKLLSDKHFNKFKAISRHFRKEGKLLYFLTDEELVHPERLNNLALMRAYQRANLKTNLNRLAEVVSAPDKVTVDDLLRAQIIPHRSEIYALLAKNIVRTDLNKLITDESQIALLGETSHENLFFSYRHLS